MRKAEIECAYNPENQQLIINRLQEEGLLKEVYYVYESHRILGELSLDWVLVNGGASIRVEKPIAHLLLNNCNLELFGQLRKGVTLKKIMPSDGTKFEAENGSQVAPIAALLYEEKPLYISPGFRLEEWQAKKRSLKDFYVKFGDFPLT